MARSLTIKHEETVSTSPLLNMFLLFAIAWMALSALVATGSTTPGATPPAQVTETR